MNNMLGGRFQHPQYVKLPLKEITSECFPKNWGILTYTEISFFNGIFPETLENCHELEENTIGQASNNTWFKARKFRITSSNVHKVFIRKKISKHWLMCLSILRKRKTSLNSYRRR